MPNRCHRNPGVLSAAKHTLTVLVCLLIPTFLHAQAQRPLTWLQDLTVLQSTSSTDSIGQVANVTQIRTEIENWLRLHPESKIQLPPAPAQPWSAEQASSEISLLHDTVTHIIEQDPNHPFHLGVSQVNVTAAPSLLSPVADSIDQTEIEKRDALNVTRALQDLPGVSVEHIYAGRNQSALYIHGFGHKEVPLYLDGIPINVPYDAALDFNRFLTNDIAEIQVAKGFSSPLMGPNAVGGAINIVTKEPQKKLDGEASIGTGSGYGLQSSLLLGTRWTHFFVQGSVDWVQSDFVPLSGNFVNNVLQPNNQLNNSYQKDAKYSGRIGWTPTGQDEYVFSYINQKANEGIPLSTGNDPIPYSSCGPNATASTCYSKSSYRDWGYWNRTSYYFHSNTALGESSSLKLRAFYDEYPNLMLFYTQPPYTPANLNTNAGFNAVYDDHSDGFSTEFTSRAIPRNTASASFFFKDDTHVNAPLIPYSGHPSTLSDRQQITSIGLQDAIPLSSRLRATLGFSADHLDGLRSSDSTAQGNTNYWGYPLTSCPGYSGPTGSSASYSSCTPHVWGYNPQVSLAYSVGESGQLFGAFAKKTRFPTMDEMYSWRLGNSIPNPNLGTEYSYNWTLGYSHTFAARTVAQVQLFRSDLRDAIESVGIGCDPALGLTGPPPCYRNANAGKEIHQGVEFTVRSTPISRLTLDGSYTYLNKSIRDLPCSGDNLYIYSAGQLTTMPSDTCLTPTGVPKHKAVVSATVRLPREIMLTSSVRYESGTQYADSFKFHNTYYDAILPMSNYATADLGGSVPLYKTLSVQAGVRNLLDRNYYYVVGYPEPGRNWYANMRYRF